MKFIKRSLAILIGLVLIMILAFNFRLFYEPKWVKHGSVAVNKDLLEQLAHLKSELHNRAAYEMQGIYPEGYLFLNALYALTWIDVANGLSAKTELHKEAHREIDWVWIELTNTTSKEPFTKGLYPSYGIFYSGWTNYVLGKKIALKPEGERDIFELLIFRQNCSDILSALKNSESPYLESYVGAAWPADMVVAMASVALYNKMYPGSFESEVEQWLIKAESMTDDLGLLPHSADWKKGLRNQPSRGSSQSLILNFLIEIDEDYAEKKFKIFEEHFVDSRLGLPGIREYPKGYEGEGDIDSGPVIWGIGGAASIVGQRTAARYNRASLAIGLRNCIEAFGLGRVSKEKKKYLFGVLPIADAFIAWSNSTEAHRDLRLETDQPWRRSFQMLSLFILALGTFTIFKLWKKS